VETHFHPLTLLSTVNNFGGNSHDVQWNFEKFLFSNSPSGVVTVKRIHTRTDKDDLEAYVVQALGVDSDEPRCFS